MPVNTTSDVDRFDEALDWLLGRVPMTRAEVDSLTTWARQRAFWITGVAKLRLLQDIRDDIARALERGDSLKDWKKLAREKLGREWLLGEGSASKQRTVLWGSTSKCVALLSSLDVGPCIDYVVDLNPRKHGHFLPGTGQEIVSPVFLREYGPSRVVVMNPVYRDEVAADLERLGIKADCVTL